jgi:hypothetical protein
MEVYRPDGLYANRHRWSRVGNPSKLLVKKRLRPHVSEKEQATKTQQLVVPLNGNNGNNYSTMNP